MNVEVCYAESMQATRVAVSLPASATVGEAVEASRIVALLSLDPAQLTYAVFGRRVALDAPLADGDRVEVLRPLVVSPKEARHRRVAKKRALTAVRSP